MKKSIALVFLVLINFCARSQALSKGNFDLHLGTGFGFYTLTSNDYKNNSSGAVPGLLNLGLAYQISDGFSLGLDYERNGFVTDRDSNTKAVSQNFGLTAGYNFLNKEKNVLQGFFHVGSSSFRFDNFNDQEYVVAKGTQLQFGVKWMHYFGETAGLFMNLSLPYYNYTEFKNSNGDVYKVTEHVNGIPTGNSRVFQASMTGINLRIGLALKFG